MITTRWGHMMALLVCMCHVAGSEPWHKSQNGYGAMTWSHIEEEHCRPVDTVLQHSDGISRTKTAACSFLFISCQ